MRITRPRATKLSQITINTDLDMGAYNITLGVGQTVDGKDVSTLIALLSELGIDADLDMGAHNITLGAGQLVDGKDVSLLNPIGWELLAEVENTETGDILELDTGVITAKDVYMIIAFLGSVTSGCKLFAQVNNLSAANYDTARFMTGDTLATLLNNAQWSLIDHVNANKSGFGVWYVLGKKDADGNIIMFGNSAATALTESEHAIRGIYKASLGDVTRLRIYSDVNATGWIKIFGMNR